MDKITEYIDLALENFILYAPKIALALVILWIGLKIIKKLERPILSLLEKAGLTETIRPFLVSIINFILYIVLFFIPNTIY